MKTLLFLLLFLPASHALADRMYLSDSRLSELQKLIKQEGTHEKAAYDVMKARVDMEDLLAAYPTGGGKYEPAFRAREAALLSLLAPTPNEQEKYADLSYEMCVKGSGGAIDQSHNQPGKKVAMDSGYGLARAIIGMNVSISYNWMNGVWPEEQSGAVKKAIDQALDAWPKYGHANFGNQRASNWVAVCRGGEMVMLLTSAEKEKRADRFQFLERELLRHINAAYGDLGVGQEGAGYTEYAGQFLLPAVFGAAEQGSPALLEAAQRKAWWKSVMYSYSFQPRSAGDGDRRFLQWGVAVRGPEEGWISLLLNLVPKDELPYYLWWYDRFAGRQAQVVGSHTAYESHRAGTTWSLIYYPSQVSALDPTGVFPKGIQDSHGFAFLRNRWADENDIQILAASDDVHHGNAWDQPDNLALRILANNAGFISGPGKSREVSDYSMLLVNGQIGGKKATSLTGKAVHFESTDNGGYFIADGGSLYEKLGVDEAVRHTSVHFSAPDGNTALVSSLDLIRSSRENTYTWQGNLGAPGGENDIQVSKFSESGRNGFLLRGGNGYVKGWVVHPAGADIRAKDPIQIETQSDNAEIWIAICVGSGDPPKATITGEGLDSQIEIFGITTVYDQKTNRIINKQ